MSPAFDASRSLTALEQDSTIIAVIEMSQSKWLVAPIVPGIKRQPLKKIDADEKAVVKLLDRWCKELARPDSRSSASSWPWLLAWCSARQVCRRSPPPCDDQLRGG